MVGCHQSSLGIFGSLKELHGWVEIGFSAESKKSSVHCSIAAETRMIWRVGLLSRPSLRDLVHLYANVASTAFIAAWIEEVDVDLFVTTIFGSKGAAIPGRHLLADAVLSGSANAFLRLRVGMITKGYCRCTTRVEKSGLRRTATLQAGEAARAISSEKELQGSPRLQ
jgi:hypothetical protein